MGQGIVGTQTNKLLVYLEPLDKTPLERQQAAEDAQHVNKFWRRGEDFGKKIDFKVELCQVVSQVGWLEAVDSDPSSNCLPACAIDHPLAWME